MNEPLPMRGPVRGAEGMAGVVRGSDATRSQRTAGYLAVFGISAARLLALAPPATATAAAPGHAVRLGHTQAVHLPARTKSPAPLSASKRHELAASLQRINRHPHWTSTRSIAGSPSAAPASPHL